MAEFGVSKTWGVPSAGVLGSMDYAGNYTPSKPDYSWLDKLAMTWPAKLAQTAWSAAMLPGEVYRGEVNPNSQEAIERAADLAGFATGVPGGIGGLGSGARLRGFHGTAQTGLDRISANPAARQYDNATSQFGAFLSPTEGGAKRYGSHMYSVEAPISKPYEMSWSEFSYFQSPNKAKDGASAADWSARASELSDEARALRERLAAEGYDGIVVRGGRDNRIIEIASFNDIPVAEGEQLYAGRNPVAGAGYATARAAGERPQGIRAYHGSPEAPIIEAMPKPVDDYRGQHTAPMADSGAPLHDLTGGGSVYPDDVYSMNAARYYGHSGGDRLDNETVSIIQGFRGRPDAMVTVYRAVPHAPSIAEQIGKLEKDMAAFMRRGKVPPGQSMQGSAWYDAAHMELARLRNMPTDVPETVGINPGDWVTINRNYAKQHGEGTLVGGYKIISKRVPAKTIFTNGDSIHEFGYDPSVMGNSGQAEAAPAILGGNRAPTIMGNR